MKKLRINYLTGYMSPHLLPLLNAVHEHPGIDLHVWYCTSDLNSRKWSHDLKPNHEYTLSKRLPFQWIHPEFHLDPGIIGFIRKSESDLTLISESDIPTLRLAISYLNWKQKPWALRGERPIFGDKSLLRIVIGLLMRNRPLRTAKAIIANGALNASIYRELSPWGKPVYSVPYYLDVGRYSFSREDGLRMFRELSGREIGDGEFLFMYAGSLIARKGVLLLIDAFNRVVEELPNASLCVVGEGPLLSEMQQKLTNRAKKRCCLLGNVDFNKIPALYAAAGALVFPTQHDGWGMVVCEAMASGMPVVTTNTCGAALDLITQGKTGYILAPTDTNGFVTHMKMLALEPDLARRMGEASRLVMEKNTPEQGAEHLYDACVKIIESMKQS